MPSFFESKQNRLWIFLAGFFLTNALVAEFIGVKLFSLEKTFGFEEVKWTLFGTTNLSFTLTAGVLLWPMVFVMTDIINEYYGRRGVKMLSWMTAGLIGYGFLMLLGAIELQPADFWIKSHVNPNWPPEQQVEALEKVGDYNEAYKLVFSQSLWIIVGSLVAFLLAQLIDAFIFHGIKRRTGEGKIWLRTTGSTFVSQFFDSFVVVFIAFYLSGKWGLMQTFSISIMSYLYKIFIAVLMTPLLYGVHFLIDRWLGEPLATEMKQAAHEGK